MIILFLKKLLISIGIGYISSFINEHFFFFLVLNVNVKTYQ